MRKFIFISIFLLEFILNANAQNISLSGYVTDSVSGEKLIYASVFESISKRGVYTNGFGYYSLQIPHQDSICLTVSYTGYQNAIEKGKIEGDISKDFRLLPSTNTLDEIIITARTISDASIGVLRLTPKQLQLIPSIGGERDVFKSFQLMPGVMQTTEGKSSMVVRGGSADQNLVILDDVPLYSIDHFTGFFSVFNDDAINSVKLIKGGFSARYGGRLSSVTDVRMKDGNMKKYSGNVSFGILMGKFMLEGPIVKDKMSFMLTARRSFIDVFMTPFTALTDGYYFNYGFYDINAKLNYKLSKKNHLYYSFYSGDDKLTTRFPDKGEETDYTNINKMRGGNFLSIIRWNHIFGDKLFGNLTTSYTKFRYFSNNEIEEKNSVGDVIYSSYNSIGSNISDYSLKYEFEYTVSGFYKIDFGTNYTKHIFKPAEINISEYRPDADKDLDSTLFSQKWYSDEFDVYIENQFNISKYIKTNVGFRENLYFINRKRFVSHEPRVVISIIPVKTFAIKVSYVQMSQNIHMMTLNNNEFFSSIWIPSNVNCPPEKAKQYSVAVETSLSSKYDLSIEAYYKDMDHLLEFTKGSLWTNLLNWESNIQINGTGESMGLELFFNKKSGKLNGWVSYTLSKSTRQFETINNGKPFPYDFDRPHDLKVFSNYKLNDHIDFSLIWIFQSGRPINLPKGYYYVLNSPNQYNIETNTVEVNDNYKIDFFPERNSYRMKPYHRLDLSVNLTKIKKKGTRIWSFSIYNVYNRLNAYYYTINFDKNEQGEVVPKLYEYSLFPIIPAFSYTYKF